MPRSESQQQQRQLRDVITCAVLHVRSLPFATCRPTLWLWTVCCAVLAKQLGKCRLNFARSADQPDCQWCRVHTAHDQNPQALRASNVCSANNLSSEKLWVYHPKQRRRLDDAAGQGPTGVSINTRVHDTIAAVAYEVCRHNNQQPLR